MAVPNHQPDICYDALFPRGDAFDPMACLQYTAQMGVACHNFRTKDNLSRLMSFATGVDVFGRFLQWKWEFIIQNWGLTMETYHKILDLTWF